MELIIDRLTKQYGSKIAVDRISRKLTPGVYGLLGANGAGKTTLMRMLCGILKPTGGSVSLDGFDVSSEEYRKALGYLPQDFGYYPNFTGKDFLMYMAALKGLDKNSAKKRCRELLNLVGLESVAGKKVKTYSGGMKQRLGIAQALLNRPKLLILDEPTAGLDPKGRDEILDQIAKLHKETGMTVVLVSHSMEDVARYVDRIIVMNKGEKMLDSTPKEVFRHYKELEEVGLAAPQVTYVMHDLKDRGFDVSPDATTIEEAADEIMRSFI